MDASRARSALAGTRFGQLTWVAETGSTNADLMAAARRGEGEQALVADHQRAGRGRLGRVWQAPAGASLLCSVLVRPRVAPAAMHLVTIAAGLAVLDAVGEVAGVSAALKWPNDCVMVGAGDDGRDLKLAGILAESQLAEDRVDALVVGIGLNVNWGDSMPAELAGIATSLDAHSGAPVDRTDLVVALLRSFESHLARAESPDGAALVRAEALRRSATVGRAVRVEAPDSVFEGRAVDLTESGHLVIESDGVRREVQVGDVIHLRPTD